MSCICNRRCGRRRCGCSSCCGCSGCCSSNGIQTLEYCTVTRYVDVPMTIYRGPGYTETECCQDTLAVLQDMAAALNRLAPAEDSCGCGNCSGCSGCSSCTCCSGCSNC